MLFNCNLDFRFTLSYHNLIKALLKYFKNIRIFAFEKKNKTMAKAKTNRRSIRRPSAREIQAMLEFFGANSDNSIRYDETFPTLREPRITITQTVIEFD